jgi:hypothetical protein
MLLSESESTGAINRGLVVDFQRRVIQYARAKELYCTFSSLLSRYESIG